jgi:uncharacterized protein YjbI with pentapeptide repeats
VGTHLFRAILREANLREADLFGADLGSACLIQAELTGANLKKAVLTTVDNIEVAQFVYLLLNNPKIRDVIDTIGKKAVLILGRFTPERKAVLDALREGRNAALARIDPSADGAS